MLNLHVFKGGGRGVTALVLRAVPTVFVFIRHCFFFYRTYRIRIGGILRVVFIAMNGAYIFTLNDASKRPFANRICSTPSK